MAGTTELNEFERSLKTLVQKAKSTTGRIRRPPNAFMLYAKDHRQSVALKHPEVSNKVISTMLGKTWKKLDSTTKEQYFQKAKMLSKKHKEAYPDYYYSPIEARERKRNRKTARTRRRKQRSKSKEEPKLENETDEDPQINTHASSTSQERKSPEYIPNFFTNEIQVYVPSEHGTHDDMQYPNSANAIPHHEKFRGMSFIESSRHLNNDPDDGMDPLAHSMNLRQPRFNEPHLRPLNAPSSSLSDSQLTGYENKFSTPRSNLHPLVRVVPPVRLQSSEGLPPPAPYHYHYEYPRSYHNSRSDQAKPYYPLLPGQRSYWPNHNMPYPPHFYHRAFRPYYNYEDYRGSNSFTPYDGRYYPYVPYPVMMPRAPYIEHVVPIHDNTLPKEPDNSDSVTPEPEINITEDSSNSNNRLVHTVQNQARRNTEPKEEPLAEGDLDEKVNATRLQ